MAIKSRKTRLPGSIYQNKNRWWWKIKLPGEEKMRARPLRPVGPKFATTDRNVAQEVITQRDTSLNQPSWSARTPNPN
ncbi:MAG: hypothetical protein ACYSUV_12580 [Planctomycetota bacterium]